MLYTLLFTDIEGSTRLARALGDAWPGALALHHDVVGGAIERHGGVIDSTEGDAFFALFDSATGALAAVVAAQRELAAAEWPGEPIRVRMGLHTGEVERTPTGFVGLEIHRAARVGAVAHGGQVLLTAAARGVLGERALDGVELEDLGQHRLKDFPEPERLFHLVIDGARADAFGPLGTLRVRPTNIPVLETALVGRVSELAVLRERLTNGSRIVTLTGQGGTGKTRLALAAAEQLLDDFPAGAWFVPLADVEDARRLLPAIAEKLDLAEEADRPLLGVVAHRFNEERGLLVLDNLEQLVGAPAAIGELVQAAAKLKVLATSQVPLHISAEFVVPLAPLSGDEGFRLFCERAATRMPGFDAAQWSDSIRGICDRLDGLPLAIELAAARTAALTPPEILARLVDALTLLRTRDSDRPERHRSLRAAIEWSFGLLEPADRDLFARLCVFVTPFGLADAEAVCGPDALDGIEQLLHHSFLRRVDTGAGSGSGSGSGSGGGEGARFTIAQTLREFGREQLVTGGELAEASLAHAQWAADLAEDTWREQLRDQAVALRRIVARLDDVMAALAWSRTEDPTLHLRLAGAALWGLADRAGGQQVARELELAMGRAPMAGAPTARGLAGLGHLAIARGDAEGARRALGRAIELWDELSEDEAAIMALTALVAAELADDPVAARRAAVNAVARARELGDTAALDLAITWLAQVDVAEGTVDQVEPLLEEALGRVTEPGILTGFRHLWADCALLREDGPEAVRRYVLAARGVIDAGMGLPYPTDLEGLAMALAVSGRLAEARMADMLAQTVREVGGHHMYIAFWEALRERYMAPAWALCAPEQAPADASEGALLSAITEFLGAVEADRGGAS